MSVSSDLDKGLTYGDADGPDIFVPTLGMEVPSFIDPRDDLIPSHAKNKFKRLTHHVPFQMRGKFMPEDWPEQYRHHVQARTDMAGFVLCDGKNASGENCGSHAVNRSHFCRNHGGALHAADKKMSGMNIQPVPEDRNARLDRVQQFMQGLIDPSDLADDEIQGSFVRNDEGIPVTTAKLGAKFQAILQKELLARLNRFLQSKAPSMLSVMVDIAENDLFEAADRLNAAKWIAERTMGRTPDVVYFGKTDSPYESIFDDHVVSTSRETYRTQIETGGHRQDVLDVELVSDTDSVEDHSDAQDTADDIEQRRNEAKAARDRIKKAKQRRFAARALGATSLDDHPWLIDYVPKSDGTYKARLVPPDRQTPSKIAKINAST